MNCELMVCSNVQVCIITLARQAHDRIGRTRARAGKTAAKSRKAQQQQKLNKKNRRDTKIECVMMGSTRLIAEPSNGIITEDNKVLSLT